MREGRRERSGEEGEREERSEGAREREQEGERKKGRNGGRKENGRRECETIQM
jgi:hypothetical protein